MVNAREEGGEVPTISPIRWPANKQGDAYGTGDRQFVISGMEMWDIRSISMGKGEKGDTEGGGLDLCT